MRSGLLVLALILILSWHPANGDSALQTVGILMASEGWHLGKQALTPGEQIQENSTLLATEQGELLLNCPRQGWLSYSCSKIPCQVRACASQVPGVLVRRVDKSAQTGLLPESSLGQTLLRFLTRESRPPVTLGVRDGAGSPSDAVVLQQSGNIHFAPALVRVLEGEYCFSLTPLNASDTRATVLRLVWNKSDEPEGLVALPSISAGVYAFEKGVLTPSGSCNVDPKTHPAWVLIAPEEMFPNLERRWKADRVWFDHLQESKENPAVITVMRHAEITDLSSSLELKRR